MSPRLSLSAIHRYPVKSCRGEALDAAVVEPWGLAGDRRWMVVDDEGAAITARTVNRLVLVTPRLTERGLRLEAPGMPPLEVDRPTGTTTSDRRRVVVFGSSMDAAVAEEAGAWVSAVVGEPAHLVHLDDPTQRQVDLRFGQDDDRVSFADGYPLLLATEASLAALDDEVLARAQRRPARGRAARRCSGSGPTWWSRAASRGPRTTGAGSGSATRRSGWSRAARAA